MPPPRPPRRTRVRALQRSGRQGTGTGGLHMRIQAVATAEQMSAFWPARRHGMPRLRQKQNKCRPCRRVSGWPCRRVASRSRWRPWRRTWPRSLTPRQGKEMRRSACTPGVPKAMSQTAERCRCRPSGLGATRCVQAGSGCQAARVTRAKGGSTWAVPKSPRDGMGTTTSRMAACPCLALELALLRPLALIPECTLTAGLAQGLSTTGTGSLSCCGTCTRWSGVNRPRAGCWTPSN